MSIPWGITQIENLEVKEGYLTVDNNNTVVVRERGEGFWKIYPALGSKPTEPHVLIYEGPGQTEEHEYALHLEEAVEGSKIIIHPKNGSKNQQWDITPNDERLVALQTPLIVATMDYGLIVLVISILRVSWMRSFG